MRLVPLFTLETNNLTNKECLPKFVQADNVSCSRKMAIFFFLHWAFSCNKILNQTRSNETDQQQEEYLNESALVTIIKS